MYEWLLELALDDPSSAVREGVLAFGQAQDAHDRSVICRAVGNAHRELRMVGESIVWLERAVAVAETAGDKSLAALARMSLAASRSYNDVDRALDDIGRALSSLEGANRVMGQSQRAGILQRAGRHREAELAFTEALAAARELDHPSHEADVLLNRGVMYGYLTRFDEARADTECARDIYTAIGWRKRAVDMVHNLAWIATREGRLGEALRLFDESERQYQQLDVDEASIYPDRVEALLLAGLAAEAHGVAEQGAHSLRKSADVVDHAEALLLVARSALAAGLHERAEQAALDAAGAFREAGRVGWDAVAEVLGVEARRQRGCVRAEDADLVDSSARVLRDAQLILPSLEASLLGAEIAIELGRDDDCVERLQATPVESLSLMLKVRYYATTARAARVRGASAEEVWRGCLRAVEQVAVLRTTAGALDLQAHLTTHADDAIALGISVAVDADDPAGTLAWVERQRGVALLHTPAFPDADHALARSLDELRRLDDDIETDEARQLQQRHSLEEAVRRRAWRLPGTDRVVHPTSATELQVRLHDRQLLELFVDRDRLVALIVGGGEVSMIPLAPMADVQTEASFLLSAHRRALADRLPGTLRAHTVSLFENAARRFEAVVLGPILDVFADAVVICTPPALRGIPWTALDRLRHRHVTFSPSARLLLEVRAPAEAGDIVLVAGPRLGMANSEVDALRDVYKGAITLQGSAATVGQVLEAMRGAAIVHLACHGRFRAGNPLFSSLELADGPLFGYDLARLAQPPQTMVLASCEAAAMSTVGHGEALGLVAALVVSGCETVIASNPLVPDGPETVRAMQALHEQLRDGADGGGALLRTRGTAPIVGAAFDAYISALPPQPKESSEIKTKATA